MYTVGPNTQHSFIDCFFVCFRSLFFHAIKHLCKMGDDHTIFFYAALIIYSANVYCWAVKFITS